MWAARASESSYFNETTRRYIPDDWHFVDIIDRPSLIKTHFGDWSLSPSCRNCMEVPCSQEPPLAPVLRHMIAVRALPPCLYCEVVFCAVRSCTNSIRHVATSTEKAGVMSTSCRFQGNRPLLTCYGLIHPGASSAVCPNCLGIWRSIREWDLPVY
jgi:hypothetical protein